MRSQPHFVINGCNHLILYALAGHKRVGISSFDDSAVPALCRCVHSRMNASGGGKRNESKDSVAMESAVRPVVHYRCVRYVNALSCGPSLVCNTLAHCSGEQATERASKPHWNGHRLHH